MGNLQKLRAGTINGAEAIGLSQDLGNLEPGKLADLVVLDKDPLQDIQNTVSILFVMSFQQIFFQKQHRSVELEVLIWLLLIAVALIFGHQIPNRSSMSFQRCGNLV